MYNRNIRGSYRKLVLLITLTAQAYDLRFPPCVLTRIMKIMNPSDTCLFKSLWYPLQRSLSLLHLGLTVLEIKSVIFKEASNFVIPHKKLLYVYVQIGCRMTRMTSLIFLLV